MSTTQKMTYSEFIDLLLARLYDLDRQSDGEGAFGDLNALAGQLNSPVPPAWVADAGRVLEAQGLVRCAFGFGGTGFGEITGLGRLFVERDQGSGIIRDYKNDPQKYFKISATGNDQQNVVGNDLKSTSEVSIENQRQPAFEALSALQEKLQEEKSLDPAEKKDMSSDLNMVRLQLKRREPNRSALAALLAPVGRVTSLAGSVGNLLRFLNP